MDFFKLYYDLQYDLHAISGNTWTVDATFLDTEFTQIAMYSPTIGIASTSQSVLHSHNIGELGV